MQVACARNNASIGSVCAAINDAAAGCSELYRRAACTISLTLAFFVKVGGVRQRRLLVSYRSILDPQVLASTTPRGRQLRSAHALLKPQSSVPPAPLPLQEARVQAVPIEPPKGAIRFLHLTTFPVAARTAPSLPTFPPGFNPSGRAVRARIPVLCSRTGWGRGGQVVQLRAVRSGGGGRWRGGKKHAGKPFDSLKGT